VNIPSEPEEPDFVAEEEQRLIDRDADPLAAEDDEEEEDDLEQRRRY
jgi:hypothetical protein